VLRAAVALGEWAASNDQRPAVFALTAVRPQPRLTRCEKEKDERERAGWKR
jgi:hypothetical protein